MRKLTTAALFGTALLTSAVADTYRIPEEKPLVNITVPDDWDTDKIDDGIESTSADGEVYFYMEAVDSSNVQSAMEEGVKYLKSKGVTVDEKSMKQQEGDINGIDGVQISWDGKDEEGAAKISLTVLSVNKDKGVLLVYWASPEGEKKNEAELGKITKSITKT